MRFLWISALVLAIDQASKYAVLETMRLGQSIPLLGDWLKLTYTENPGMAFGLTFGPPGMITIFSIIATVLIVLYMWRIRGIYAPYGFSLAMVLGGAVGNIIDRVFYGAWFYDWPLFTGRVVDFVHVDVGTIMIPTWLPRAVGGGSTMQMLPIWNVADMAIVGGVIGILLFQKTFHERLAAQHSEQAAADKLMDAAAMASATPAGSTTSPADPAASPPAEHRDAG